MRPTPTRNEGLLLAACGLLLLLALFGPHLAQPPHAHDFADRRTLWGIPHALDVLSNLPFAMAGIGGGALLLRTPRGVLPPAQRACAHVFFAGLLLTAAGSAWYHLAPGDAGLAVDRAAMAVTFAGLLGLLAASRVSERAGRALLAALLVLAPAAAAVWFLTGNVLPWAAVQFGGILVILLVLAAGRPAPEGLQVRWSLVLLAYAVAKLCEATDHAILEASGQLFSGHTLKHVAAAFAAVPVIAALAPRARRQNEAEAAAQAA